MWLYAFAAALALTIQAKVTGVLVLVIAVNYLLVSKELRRLSVRRFLLASLAFLVFFIPVLVQIALKSDQLLEFLGDSGQRATHVPWYYYLDKLIVVRGLRHARDLAGRHRHRAAPVDARATACSSSGCSSWPLFFQVYPLKAFNYLLPLIPALSILAGRAVHDVALAIARALEARCERQPGVGWVARAATARSRCRWRCWRPCLRAVLMASPVVEVARTDSYFGLREAAKWLKANTQPEDGVMTLSKGSAQYALSFYAHRDAYPFGRFRLATVLPGGKVRSPHPAAGRPVPRLGQLLAAAAGQEPRGLVPRLLHGRG